MLSRHADHLVMAGGIGAAVLSLQLFYYHAVSGHWLVYGYKGESFDFLQKLDDLEERVIDNADYKPIGSIDALSDDQLIDALLDEYGEYVTEARRLGMVV